VIELSLLAYDRARLRTSLAAMQSTADALSMILNADKEASSAMTCVRVAQDELANTYIPLTRNILSCVAMTGVNPTSVDQADVRFALARTMSGAYGWSVVTDPLPDVPWDVTPEEARALGVQLRDPDVLSDGLDTVEELEWLRASLTTIANNPALLADFLINIGDGWPALLDRLGKVHLSALERENYGREEPGRAQAALMAIVSVAGVFAANGDSCALDTIVATAEPYGAAIFLAELPLTDQRFANLSYRLLKREHETFYPDRIDSLHGGDNAADFLFAALSRQPEAAAEFIDLALADEPMVLFQIAHNDDNTAALLIAGTSPSVRSEEEAGRVIPHIIEVSREYETYIIGSLFSDASTPELRNILAALIAPWLMNFTSRTEQWNWSNDDADDALRWVIADDDAFGRLVDEADAVRAQLSELELLDSDGSFNHQTLYEVAELFAKLESAILDAQLDDAERDRFWASLVMETAGILVSAFAVTSGGPAASIAVDGAISLASPFVERGLRALGIFPPTAEESERQYGSMFSERLTDAAVIAVVAMAEQVADPEQFAAAVAALETRPIREGCTAEQINENLLAFVEALNLPEHERAMLLSVTDLFINPGSTAQMCE
jgi:hypothetical protein